MTYPFVAARCFTPQGSVPAAFGGRARKITGVTIHHWGVDGQSHSGVVNFFATEANTSAHYVCSGAGVTQMVKEEDAAWHSGHPRGNTETIGIELRPEATDADYAQAARLVADIWKRRGRLPLYPHSTWYNTACPGRWNLARLEREALAVSDSTTGKGYMKPYSPEALAVVRAAMFYAKGKCLDPDGAYGFQCVDVIDWAAEYLTGLSWQTVVGGVNGANQLHTVAPAKYWEWEWNVPGDVNSIPPEGSFVILDGVPGNPYGHVAWVGTADPYRVYVLEQNSNGQANLPLGESSFDYENNGVDGYGYVLGWLKLREEFIKGVKKAAPAPAPAPKKPATPVPTKTPTKNAVSTTAKRAESKLVWIVDPGDTLSAIAAYYGVAVSDLAKANGIKDANQLKVGQRLSIPGKVVYNVSAGDIQYALRTGEGVAAAVGRHFGVDGQYIRTLNGWSATTNVQAGTSVLIQK